MKKKKQGLSLAITDISGDILTIADRPCKTYKDYLNKVTKTKMALAHLASRLGASSQGIENLAKALCGRWEE